MTMKTSTSLPELVAERERLMARVDEIDVILREEHGLEMVVKVRRSRPQRAAILAALASGPKDGPTLAELTGQGVHAVQQMVHMMARDGAVVRVSHGVYGLPSKPTKKGGKR